MVVVGGAVGEEELQALGATSWVDVAIDCPMTKLVAADMMDSALPITMFVREVSNLVRMVSVRLPSMPSEGDGAAGGASVACGAASAGTCACNVVAVVVAWGAASARVCGASGCPAGWASRAGCVLKGHQVL